MQAASMQLTLQSFSSPHFGDLLYHLETFASRHLHFSRLCRILITLHNSFKYIAFSSINACDKFCTSVLPDSHSSKFTGMSVRVPCLKPS